MGVNTEIIEIDNRKVSHQQIPGKSIKITGSFLDGTAQLKVVDHAEIEYDVSTSYVDGDSPISKIDVFQEIAPQKRKFQLSTIHAIAIVVIWTAIIVLTILAK